MSLVPKIKINISFDELSEVCDSFVEIPQIIFNDRGNRVFYNVLDKVIDKLLKKQLSKRHVTEKFSLSLEYYEAHYLERWLIYKGSIDTSSHTQNIINKLNQKLA